MNNDDIVLYNTEDKVAGSQPGIETFDLVDATDPVLHKALPEFDFENASINPNDFASSLVETCRKHNGLGLSANQCGFEHRVFVMGADNDYIACFNPKIVGMQDEVHMEEGCLSFPGLYLNVKRPESVVVQYEDLDGRTQSKELKGLMARVFLHEYDHLMGICFTDRVADLSLKLANGRRAKNLKKR